MSRSPRSHRVTLALVAKEASVSVTTASLVLSGRTEALAQFQAETIERVRRSAEVLGYRANLFAASLLAERSSFFALIVRPTRHADPDAWRYSAYDAEFMSGVTETTTAHEVYPIVAMAGPDAAETRVQAIERIMAGGVFGTIARTPGEALSGRLRDRMQRRHPVVVVFPEPDQGWSHNTIDVDNLAVGRGAGRLLADRRAKRWLLIRDAAPSGQESRETGCRSIAGEAEAQCETVEVSSTSGLLEPDRVLMQRIGDFRPDGVFGLTLRTSVLALDACQRAGIRLGTDAALVGCDCAFWLNPPNPRITSIDVSWFDTGAAAIRKLMQMAEGKEERFEPVLLPPRILAGDTCPVPDGQHG